MSEKLSATKRDIVLKIHKRLYGTVSQSEILDVINVICEYIVDNLKNNLSFSVKNFGTLSVREVKGHDGVDVSTGNKQFVGPFKTVKFYPHQIFKRLVKEKKENFFK